MKYIWQREKWPVFQYKLTGIQDQILSFIEKTGRVDGLLSALPESIKTETIIDLMVAEAVKSSEIEGEMLSRPDVMSSIKNNFGLNAQPKRVGDRRAEGIAELMLCIRNDFAKPLSRKMLFEWHSMLMMGTPRIKAGVWRSLTNVSQEGFNNKVGWQTRQTYGYRDEEYLYLKIYDLPHLSTRRDL